MNLEGSVILLRVYQTRVQVLSAVPEIPSSPASSHKALHRPIKQQTEIIFFSNIISRLLCNVGFFFFNAS